MNPRSLSQRNRILLATVAAVVWFATPARPAESKSTTPANEKGAKALFVDSMSGAEIDTSGGVKPPKSHRDPVPARAGAPKHVADVPRRASGLMYWIELVRPSGEAVRVTSDRVFHSGERIRLHLTGNIDGDVAVYQRADDGKAMMLFPDVRVNGGSAVVAKGAATVVPSESTWFRFDDRVGVERITVILTPRPMRYEAPARPTLVAAARNYDELRPQEGSKGLVLESDPGSADAATYVVRPASIGSPVDPVIVEIELRHER
jgi:hypothetical protein